MHAASLELDGVRVARGKTVAIDRLTLAVAPGERIFLLGPNGAGKTSLLLALVGAASFEGAIRVGGVALGPSTLAQVRREIAFVFADPTDQFFLDDVEEEVAFGPRERGLEPGEVQRRVERALGAVGLDGRTGRSPLELSLGEQRRLAVATALAIEPRLLLFDEPTASLDPRARAAVIQVIRELGSTLVVATHDLDAALAIGGRAVLLDAGRVVRDGPTDEVLLDETGLRAAGLELPLSVAGRRGR
jgi:cobalt/nickel transport system ATP-binding protein